MPYAALSNRGMAVAEEELPGSTKDDDGGGFGDGVLRHVLVSQMERRVLSETGSGSDSGDFASGSGDSFDLPSPLPPPPSSSPPPPPLTPGGASLTEVDLVVTLAGTVETFDAANFTLHLAALVGVEPAAITLNVTAASVRVAATIRVVGEAVNVVASVQALANNASALSQAAGVTVESVALPTISVQVVVAPSPPPPSPPPPSPSPPSAPGTDEDDSGLQNKDLENGRLEDALTAAGIVASAILVACGILLVARRRRLKKQQSVLIHSTEKAVGPTFVASTNGSSDLYSKQKPDRQSSESTLNQPENSELGVQIDVLPQTPPKARQGKKGVLLEAMADWRAGLAWFRPIQVQLVDIGGTVSV